MGGTRRCCTALPRHKRRPDDGSDPMQPLVYDEWWFVSRLQP